MISSWIREFQIKYLRLSCWGIRQNWLPAQRSGDTGDDAASRRQQKVVVRCYLLTVFRRFVSPHPVPVPATTRVTATIILPVLHPTSTTLRVVIFDCIGLKNSARLQVYQLKTYFHPNIWYIVSPHTSPCWLPHLSLSQCWLCLRLSPVSTPAHHLVLIGSRQLTFLGWSLDGDGGGDGGGIKNHFSKISVCQSVSHPER